MSVQVEKQEKNLAKLTIEVPAEEFEKAMQETFLKEKNSIQVPGFRKGKVPRMLIEKMYGPQVFYEGAADLLLQREYPKAAEESGLEILTQPKVEITQIEKGKPFCFTAVVAVYPEVTLGQYKGIEVPIQNTEVKEEDVEADLKREQETNSRLISIEDAGAEQKDKVTFDFHGTVEGEPFEDGTAENYELELGSGTFIPGFEDQLTGVKAGEERDVRVTFPSDYHAEDLRGKEAVFHCVIHKIERKELPEIDDEFAQDVSEFDTLEEYKESIRQEIAESKKAAAKRADENEAVLKASRNATIELSDLIIDEETKRIVDDYTERLRTQGLSLEQYCSLTGTTPEQMMQNLRPDAEQRLREQFTLDKVAEVENLEVTEERFRSRIEEMAEVYNLEPEKFEELIGEDYKERIRKDLRADLAAEFIGEHSVETQAATDAKNEQGESGDTADKETPDEAAQSAETQAATDAKNE